MSWRFRFASLTVYCTDRTLFISAAPCLWAIRYCTGLNDPKPHCASRYPLLLTKDTLYRSVGFNTARCRSVRRGGLHTRAKPRIAIVVSSWSRDNQQSPSSTRAINLCLCSAAILWVRSIPYTSWIIAFSLSLVCDSEEVTSDVLKPADSSCLFGIFAPDPLKCFDTATDVHSSLQWDHHNPIPPLCFFYAPPSLSEYIVSSSNYNIFECRKAGNKEQARRPISWTALRRAFRLW